MKRFFPTINPFDRWVKKAVASNCATLALIWNRGLGDIPLGLYALFHRLTQLASQCEVVVFTRPDLEQAFKMLPFNTRVEVVKTWKRGQTAQVPLALKQSLSPPYRFLDKIDPTRWFKWQINTLTPRLVWQAKWDFLPDRFALSGSYIACHLQSETAPFYGYVKDWPLPFWEQLIALLSKHEKKVILFGMEQKPFPKSKYVLDLRGKTTFLEMLSILKNHCSTLIAPDSGVLSTFYYLDADFPMKIVSLWADPKQGVLRQKVASPNKRLSHIPLCGKNKDITTISVADVFKEVLQ